jgi:hypothetical protein
MHLLAVHVSSVGRSTPLWRSGQQSTRPAATPSTTLKIGEQKIFNKITKSLFQMNKNSYKIAWSTIPNKNKFV